MRVILGCGIFDGWGDYEHLKTVLNELKRYGIVLESILVCINFIQKDEKRDEIIKKDMEIKNIKYTEIDEKNLSDCFSTVIAQEEKLIVIDVSYPSTLLKADLIKKLPPENVYTFYELGHPLDSYSCFGFTEGSWGIKITPPLSLEQSTRPEFSYVPVYLKKTGATLSPKEINAVALFFVTSFIKNDSNQFLLPCGILETNLANLGIEEDKVKAMQKRQLIFMQKSIKENILEAAKGFKVSVNLNIEFIDQPKADKDPNTIYIIYGYFAPEVEYKNSFENGCLVSGDNTIALAFSLCANSLPFFQASFGCIKTAIEEIVKLCSKQDLKDLKKYIETIMVISLSDKIDARYINTYHQFFNCDNHQKILQQWQKLRQYVIENLNFQEIFKDKLGNKLAARVSSAMPSSDYLSREIIDFKSSGNSNVDEPKTAGEFCNIL